MATIVGELVGVLSLDDQLSGPLGKIGKSLGLTGETFGTITKVAGTAVAAIGAVTGAIVMLGNRGATVGDVQEQFGTLTQRINSTADAMLGVLRKGTVGAISDFELMKTANLALGRGLKVTNDEMGTIAEGSRILAKRVGGDTLEAFEAITRTITTGTTKGLKQFGVDAKLVEQNIETMAAAMGKTVGQLTAAEQKMITQRAVMATLRKEIADVGVGAADFGEKIDGLKVRFANFVDGLSVAINDSPVFAAALDAIGESIDAAFGGDPQKAIQFTLDLLHKFAIGLTHIADIGVTVAQHITMAWNALKAIISGVMGVVTLGIETVTKVVAAFLETAAAIPGIGDKFAGAARAVRDTATQLQGMRESFFQQTMEAVENGDKNAAAIGKIHDSIADVRAAMITAMNTQGKLEESTTKVATAYQGAEEEVREMSEAEKKLIKTTKELTDSLNLATKNNELERWLQNHTDELDEFINKAREAGRVVPEELKKALVQGLMIKEREKLILQSQEYTNAQAIRSQEKMNEATSKNLAVVNNLRKESSQYFRSLTMSDLEFQKSIIRDEMAAVAAGLDKNGAHYDEAMKQVAEITEIRMAQATKAYNEGLDKMKDDTMSFSQFLQKNLGPTILQAFTGGGNVGKAVGGLIGGFAGDKIGNAVGNMAGKAIGAVAGKAIGSTLGMAVGSIIPGLGTMIGGMLGGAIGGLFGPDKNELEARQLRGEWSKSLEAMMTPQQRKEAGGEQWKIDVIAVRDAFVGVGLSAEMAEKAVKRVWEADSAKEFHAAVQQVNEVLGITATANQSVTDAMQRWGISTEEMGEKFRNAQISQTAQSLIKDWTVLEASGADMVAVTGKMQEGFQQYFNTVIKAGGEIPKAMEAPINKMIEMGLLTDENGEAFKSFEETGLTVSETMTEALGTFTEELKKLVAALTGTLTPAMLSTQDVGVSMWDRFRRGAEESEGALGGVRGAWHSLRDDLERGARAVIAVDSPDTGSFLGRATGSPGMSFEDWGTGTPVMLHGKETVVNESQANSLATMLRNAVGGGGRGGAPVVNITINGYVSEEMIHREFIPAITRSLKYNTGDSKVDWQNALGVTRA